MLCKQAVVQKHIFTYYHSPEIDSKNCYVFLHGWGQNWSTFHKIFEILEKKHISYVSIDLPWFWKTPLIDANWQIEDYGNFVIDIIEKLWLQKPILIGHSFWGRITIYIASFYKNLHRIVLIGSAGIKSTPNYLKLAVIKTGKYIFSLPWLNHFYSKLKNKIASEDNKNAGKLSKIFKNTIGNDLRKYMDTIDYQSTLIWWTDDTQTPIEEGKMIHQHIKNSHLKIIQKGTHFVYDEFPNEVEKLLHD